jgi:hypothetical protein
MTPGKHSERSATTRPEVLTATPESSLEALESRVARLETQNRRLAEFKAFVNPLGFPDSKRRGKCIRGGQAENAVNST